MNEQLEAARLVECQTFVTAQSDGRDRVLIRILTPAAENWFDMSRENFLVLADRLHADAQTMRAEALERTEAIARRLGMGGIESKE